MDLVACRNRAHHKTKLIAALTLLGLGIAATASAGGWVTLVGNHPAEVADLGVTHSASLNDQLKMHLALSVRDSSALESALDDIQNPSSPNFHQWLTPQQFADRFGPSAADTARVTKFLARNGFRVLSSGQVKRGVTFSGTVAQAEHAFGVNIVTSADGQSFANVNDPSLPADIAPLVTSIGGLDNLVHSAPAVTISSTTNFHPATPDVTIGGATHFGPADFYAFYNETPLLNDNIDGTGTECIALLEDSNFSLDSANAFNTQFDLPAFSDSNLSVILVDSGTPSDADALETLIDLNYSHAIAPGAPIAVYIGNNATAATGSGIIDALRSAVTQNQCSSIVMSFSFCGVSTKFYKMVDSLFAQAAMQGQSVVVATGDAGANGLVFKKKQRQCLTASTGIHPSEVAASPNVTSVGGTQFTPNYVNGVDVGNVPESVWNDGVNASGGGKSKIFRKPAYQAGLFIKDKKRDYPDVAFAASGSQPGFWASFPTQTTVGCCVEGTSLGAPSWAGVAQLISQESGGRLGNLNPRLYGMASGGQPAGVRDVTTGSNGIGIKGYSAGPGFDLTTGWGTPDMGTFVPAFLAK